MRTTTRLFRLLAVMSICGGAACDSPTAPSRNIVPVTVAGPPAGPAAEPAAIAEISPASAPAGSSDITITVSGANFSNQDYSHTTVALWSTDAVDRHCCNRDLRTTFVSNSELAVVIPAALLQNPGTAQIFVMIGDPMGISDGVTYPISNSVTFTVVPPDLAAEAARRKR